MLWLAIVGIVFAVIGAFYYLRVIKAMYFDEPVGRQRAGAAGVRRVLESVHGVVPAGVRLTGTRQ
jgi:NADH-quinone oxidoreductase subunit N